MANRKKPQVPDNIRLDMREKGTEDLKEMKKDNNIPEYLKELQKLTDLLNKNISVLPSEIASSLEKINAGNGNTKDFDKLINNFEKLDDNIKKNLDKNIAKILKWKSSNKESAKAIEELKRVSLSFEGDKDAQKFTNILDEIVKRAADGEYSIGQLAKKITDIDFSSAKNGSALLENLSVEAQKCGVSVSTLGMNFDASGKRLNVFNKVMEDGFNKVKRLREDFDKCSASTFAFGLAVYSTSKKLISIHDQFKDVIGKTIEYRRSLQTLSGASPDLIPGGAKKLDDIRRNMNLTREETVKFAQIAQELRGTTYQFEDLTNAMKGMKETIGEVDVSQLEKLAGVMKSIPKEQLDAFAGGGTGTNANAAVLNMIKSGKTQDVDSLITSGALGKNAAQAAGVKISEGDKGYLDAKRTVATAKETIQNKATDATSGFLKYLPYLAGIGALGGISAKMYGQLTAFKGAFEAVRKIIDQEMPSVQNDVSEINKKISSKDVKQDKTNDLKDKIPQKAKKKKQNRISKENGNHIPKENVVNNIPTKEKKKKRNGKNIPNNKIDNKNYQIMQSIRGVVRENFRLSNTKLDVITGVTKQILGAITNNNISDSLTSIGNKNKSRNINGILRKSGHKSIDGKILNREQRIARVNAYRSGKTGKSLFPTKPVNNINRITKSFSSLGGNFNKTINTVKNQFGLLTKFAKTAATALGTVAIAGTAVVGAFNGYQKSILQYDKDREFWGNSASKDSKNSMINESLSSVGDIGWLGLNRVVKEMYSPRTITAKEEEERRMSVDRMMGKTTLSVIDSAAAGTAIGAAIGSFFPVIGTAAGAAAGAAIGGAIGYLANIIADVTEDKNLRKIYEEIYDSNKSLINIKRLNAAQNQHFKRQAVYLNGILTQIKDGAFAAVENLNTSVSLSKMENSFLLGLNKENYNTESSMAQTNSFNSFNKTMKELNKRRNIIQDDYIMSFSQKVLLLGQITQQEIEIRKKFQQEFLNSISLKNIPTVIEGELTQQFNKSSIKMNGRSNTFFGSTDALTSKLGENIEISLSNFSDSINKFTGNISDISSRNKKYKDEQIKLSDKAANRLLKVPKMSENESFMDMNKKFIDSFDTKTGLFQRQNSNTLKFLKLNNGSARTYESFGKNGVYDYNAMSEYRKNGGEIVDVTIPFDFTSPEEVREELKKDFGRIQAVFENQNSSSSDMSKALSDYIRSLEIAKEGGNYDEGANEQISMLKQQYQALIDVKKLQEKYNKEFSGFAKDASTMTESDFKEALNNSELRKEFEKSGILDESGNVKSGELDTARSIYSRKRDEVVKNVSLMELSNDDSFKEIMKKYNVDDISKADSNLKDKIFQEYKLKISEKSSNSLANTIYSDNQEKRDNFIKAQQGVEESNNYYQNIPLNQVELDGKKFNENMSSAVENALEFNAGISQLRGKKINGLTGTELERQIDSSNRATEIVSKINEARQSGSSTVQIGDKEYKTDSEEVRKLFVSNMRAIDNARIAISNADANINPQMQRLVSTYEEVNAAGKNMASSLYDNAQNIDQLASSQEKLMSSIMDLTKVLELDANVRRKELEVTTQKAKLAANSWSGNGNIGEAKGKVFEAELDLNKTKQNSLASAKSRLLKISSNMQTSGFGNGIVEYGSRIVDNEFSGDKNKSINKNLKDMFSVVQKNAGKTDEASVSTAIDEINNYAKNAKEELKKRYSSGAKEDQEKLTQETQKIDSMVKVAQAMVSAGGDINQAIKVVEMQQAQTTAELIGKTKEYISALKSNTETLQSFTAQAKQFKFDNLTNLLKVNFGSTKDIKGSMISGMAADKQYFDDQIKINQQSITDTETRIQAAESQVANASTPEEKKQASELLAGLKAGLDTAIGKSFELQAQRMAAVAKRINDSLNAISTKFQLAAEAVDILKDRAENVAGTTEEWFRLENERLSLMNQEVTAMKDLINQKTLEGASAEDTAKLRNQLMRKELEFEKAKIGAQRNVFEKQLGAIVGGLQQSGAFRGMSKAAIFGVGHGENEAGMAVQHTNKNKFGYTDRMANANNFMFDLPETTPTGRMASAGDIVGAASAHNQMDGKNEQALNNALGIGNNIVNPGKMNETKAAKATASIDSKIEEVKQQAERGEITKEEKERKVEELKDAKDKIAKNKEVSKLSNDDVFKSILSYVIDITDILKTGSLAVSSNDSFNKNGVGTKPNKNEEKKSNSEKTKSDNNKKIDEIKKTENNSFGKLSNNVDELKRREEHQNKIDETKSDLEKQLKRDDITQGDREQIKEKLQAINIAENTADKSGKTNKERIAELKSKVEAGKQLATIYENESIARDTTGKYSEEEKMKAKQKVESTKSTMNKQASMEYIAQKDQNVLTMRNELSRLDPNSDKAKELQKQISQNEEDSLGVFSNLSGDDLKAAAVQKEVEYVERQKQIDQLKQGNSTERESAARLQKQLDEDISKTDAVLDKKGVNVGEIIDAGRKKEDLEAVNGQLSKTDSRITELQGKQSSGDEEKEKRLAEIAERKKKLQSANELYTKSLRDGSIQWGKGVREKVVDSRIKNQKELEQLNAEEAGLKSKSSLTPEEQKELDRLNEEKKKLQEQKTEIEGRKDYGVFQDESKKTSQPDSATVAQITKNNEDAKAKVENKQALEAIALGENQGKINKAGSDGQVVDMFGVNKTENTTSSGGGSSGSANMEIVLKLDNATLAREVVKIIAGNDNFRIMHSAGGQVSYRNTSNPN